MISIIFELAKKFAGEEHARDEEMLLRDFGGQAKRTLRDWNGYPGNRTRARNGW